MTQLQLFATERRLERTYAPRDGLSIAEIRRVATSFLDAASTAFGRATHYNSREEQAAASFVAHDDMRALDRGVYALLLGMPGVTDYARGFGVRLLLGSGGEAGRGLLTATEEEEAIGALLRSLPATRLVKLAAALGDVSPGEGLTAVNNRRTRRVFLGALLGARRLELWAVKYRTKLAKALAHLWGQRTTAFVRSVLRKRPEERTRRERDGLQRHVGRHARRDGAVAFEAVSYVFGDRSRLQRPLFRAVVGARRDLGLGRRLPLEVLEGIRSRFHPEVARARVLELTKDRLGAKVRLRVQRTAKKHGVAVEVDYGRFTAAELYVYAFAQGLSDDVAKALAKRADAVASGLPFPLGRVVVVVDASASMAGHASQALRPMATALALRDVFVAAADAAEVVYAGGRQAAPGSPLVRPSGSTDLARALLAAVTRGVEGEAPDHVIVVSDGYENRTAGRFGEVVDGLRRVGFDAPIVQLSPVHAAEVGGVRALAPGVCPALPTPDPTGLPLALLRARLELDPVAGLNALVRVASEHLLAGGAPLLPGSSASAES